MVLEVAGRRRGTRHPGCRELHGADIGRHNAGWEGGLLPPQVATACSHSEGRWRPAADWCRHRARNRGAEGETAGATAQIRAPRNSASNKHAKARQNMARVDAGGCRVAAEWRRAGGPPTHQWRGQRWVEWWWEQCWSRQVDGYNSGTDWLEVAAVSTYAGLPQLAAEARGGHREYGQDDS